MSWGCPGKGQRKERESKKGQPQCPGPGTSCDRGRERSPRGVIEKMLETGTGRREIRAIKEKLRLRKRILGWNTEAERG